jgi:hypothetical protein
MEAIAALRSDSVALLVSGCAGDFNPDSTLDGLDADSVPPLLLHSPPLISAAAFFGATNCFLHLRAVGADIEKCDRSPLALRPVHFAVAAGRSEIANLALCSGADPAGILYCAVEFEAFAVLSLCLRLGWEALNSRAFGGVTALERSIDRGFFAVAELLLARGAEFDPALVDQCRSAGKSDFADLLLRYQP